MKIGIISLGLIGGSILKSLADEDFEIFVVTRNVSSQEAAKKFTKNISSEISSVRGCDVIFVCSPISRTNEKLDELESIVSKDTIVMDVASVKEFLMKNERPYKFIGSHPMAGSEKSGFEASTKELFEGATWVLTPQENISEGDIEIAKAIIEHTGAKTVIADAKSHDKAVAMISHLPLMISQALFCAAEGDELAMELAASGFRDMTRLAMSNTLMATDMLDYNHHNIISAWRSLKLNFKELLDYDYLEKANDIAEKRAEMYNKEGKNTYNKEP